MFHADLAAIGPFGRDLILLSVQDVRALFRAVAESEAVGLEPEALGISLNGETWNAWKGNNESHRDLFSAGVGGCQACFGT